MKSVFYSFVIVMISFLLGYKTEKRFGIFWGGPVFAITATAFCYLCGYLIFAGYL